MGIGTAMRNIGGTVGSYTLEDLWRLGEQSRASSSLSRPLQSWVPWEATVE